jgi:membrane protease subunit HflK
MNQNDFLSELENIDLSKYKGVIKNVVGILVVAFTGYTSLFTVNPEEKAVVLRFGKVNRIKGPGYHFKLPFSMEQAFKVPVQRQLTLHFGFRTEGGLSQSLLSESLMVTGDLNVANIEWVTLYTINDPVKYMFRVRNVDQTFRDMNEAVMREVVGDRTINEVLTIGRTEIILKVLAKLEVLAEEYSLGIKVDQVILQDVNPPASVKPAFDAVNEAQQEMDTTIQKAKKEYNDVIPKAEGTAIRTVTAAEGYKIKRINEATGAASQFTQVFEEYLKAPEVTRQRIYLETMATIYKAVDQKIIIDENANGLLPLLNIPAINK